MAVKLWARGGVGLGVNWAIKALHRRTVLTWRDQTKVLFLRCDCVCYEICGSRHSHLCVFWEEWLDEKNACAKSDEDEMKTDVLCSCFSVLFPHPPFCMWSWNSMNMEKSAICWEGISVKVLDLFTHQDMKVLSSSHLIWSFPFERKKGVLGWGGGGGEENKQRFCNVCSVEIDSGVLCGIAC